MADIFRLLSDRWGAAQEVYDINDGTTWALIDYVPAGVADGDPERIISEQATLLLQPAAANAKLTLIGTLESFVRPRPVVQALTGNDRVWLQYRPDGSTGTVWRTPIVSASLSYASALGNNKISWSNSNAVHVTLHIERKNYWESSDEKQITTLTNVANDSTVSIVPLAGVYKGNPTAGARTAAGFRVENSEIDGSLPAPVRLVGVGDVANYSYVGVIPVAPGAPLVGASITSAYLYSLKPSALSPATNQVGGAYGSVAHIVNLPATETAICKFDHSTNGGVYDGNWPPPGYYRAIARIVSAPLASININSAARFRLQVSQKHNTTAAPTIYYGEYVKPVNNNRFLDLGIVPVPLYTKYPSSTAYAYLLTLTLTGYDPTATSDLSISELTLIPASYGLRQLPPHTYSIDETLGQEITVRSETSGYGYPLVGSPLMLYPGYDNDIVYYSMYAGTDDSLTNGAIIDGLYYRPRVQTLSI